MNPGTLATAAFASPHNLLIVAIDNGAYDQRKPADARRVLRGPGTGSRGASVSGTR